MRAGAFAEKQVIDLINRRFVPFYFNTGGPGEGKDPAAEDFVRGKTRNQWAYLAAFHPDGTYIDETELYADEDEVYSWLLRLLDRFPGYAALTAAEQAKLDEARLDTASVEQRRAGAQLAEELGQVELARDLHRAAGGLESSVALTRIARKQSDWDRHRELRSSLPEGMDRAVEEGYAALHEERWDDAIELFEAAIRRYPEHARHAEARCYAGKACFHADRRDRAKYHWMWVVENRPEDRFFMRCRIAAAADRMPYPNSLLDGYKAPVGMIRTHDIENAVLDARQVYLDHAPLFEQGWVEEPATPVWSQGPVGSLVHGLRDGDEHVLANNEVVEALVERGAEALPALQAAVEDPGFEGRGYAAYALALVLEVLPVRPPAAVQTLRRAQEDADPSVRLLSRSGSMRLRRAEAREAPAREGERSPDEADELVRKLRDGNPHVPANNRVVDRLEVLGEDSVQALIDAIRDPDFEGRGYAAWALGVVLAGCGAESPAGRALLEACGEDADEYVRVLSRSGHSVLRASEGLVAGKQIRAVESPVLLIAELREPGASGSRNSAVESRLRFLGAPCIPGLMAAIEDRSFPGRAAAIGVLGEIMAQRGVRDAAALRAIREATNEEGMIGEIARYALEINRDVE